MVDDPTDLSPLDPTRGPRFDRIVGRIRDEAAPLLAARKAKTDLIAEVGKWRRPVLAVAATIAVVVGATAVIVEPSASQGRSGTDLLGVPDRWSQWATTDRPPQPSSIVDFFVEQP
jgi:hypothetical protein